MTTNDYQTAVAAYADELRSLFAPEPADAGDETILPQPVEQP